MGLLGAIGNKIGEIKSEAQEKAAETKAENAEARAASETEKNEAYGALAESAGSIFTVDEDEVGQSVFGSMAEDAAEALDDLGDAFTATVKDVFTDISTTIGDNDADRGAAVETVTGAAGTVAKAVAGGIGGVFGALANAFTSGAESALEDE